MSTLLLSLFTLFWPFRGLDNGVNLRTPLLACSDMVRTGNMSTIILSLFVVVKVAIEAISSVLKAWIELRGQPDDEMQLGDIATC